jgi:hypothetical protein
MTFAEAMYNCMLRRMELVAFDQPEELHEYWTYSGYYGKIMSIGISLFLSSAIKVFIFCKILYQNIFLFSVAVNINYFD